MYVETVIKDPKFNSPQSKNIFLPMITPLTVSHLFHYSSCTIALAGTHHLSLIETVCEKLQKHISIERGKTLEPLGMNKKD